MGCCCEWNMTPTCSRTPPSSAGSDITRRLLEGIAAHPESRISELPLLDDEEKRKILVEFNQTEAQFPRDRRAS